MKTILFAALLLVGTVASANDVTKTAKEVRVDGKAAEAVKVLIQDGKGSYRLTDANGQLWRVTVSPVKAKAQ